MPKKTSKTAKPQGVSQDLHAKLLGHTDLHDLADMPDLEGSGHGHAHAGQAHGHAHDGVACTGHGGAAPAGHGHGHAHDGVACTGHGGAGHGEETADQVWRRRKVRLSSAPFREPRTVNFISLMLEMCRTPNHDLCHILSTLILKPFIFSVCAGS